MRSIDFPLLFLHIGLNIEIQEQYEEHCSMEENDVAVVFWKITFNEYWKTRVNEERGKLYQLHGCQVSDSKMLNACKDINVSSPLPPEIFLNTWTKAAHEVVEVHEDMNTHVEESYKGCVSSSHPSTRMFVSEDVVLIEYSYLTPDQAVRGMMPWWITWRVERWVNFFLNKKKRESK